MDINLVQYFTALSVLFIIIVLLWLVSRFLRENFLKKNFLLKKKGAKSTFITMLHHNQALVSVSWKDKDYLLLVGPRSSIVIDSVSIKE